MADEFHHNLWRDAAGEGHADSVPQNYHQQGSQQDKVIGLPGYWKAKDFGILGTRTVGLSAK